MATEKRIKIVIDNREAKRKIDETDDSMRGLGKSTDGATRALGALSKVATAVISAVAIQRVIAYADKFSELQTQLKLVTDSTRELNNTTQTLLELSNSTASSLDGTVGIYTKLTRATEQLGSSEEEILDVTRAINQSFVISGASAEEASNAIRQLNQGLASGVLRGEEFNAINENADRLARALADSLGVTRGELRELAKQGALTTEVVFNALKTQASAIDEEFKQVDLTVGRAFSNLNDAATVSVGRLDQATGASGRLAEAIDSVADSINSIEPSAFDIAGEVAATASEVNALISPLGIAAQQFEAIFDVLEDIAGNKSLTTLNSSLKETVRLSGELSKLTGLPSLVGGPLVTPPETTGVERVPQNQEFMGQNKPSEDFDRGLSQLRLDAAAAEAQAREELERQNQQRLSEQFVQSEQQRTERLKLELATRQQIQKAYQETRFEEDASFYERQLAQLDFRTQSELARLEQKNILEQERIAERRELIKENEQLDFEARQEALAEIREQSLAQQKIYEDKQTRIEQEAANTRTEIKKAEENAKLQATLGAASTIVGAIGELGKKSVKIQKAVALAQAGISIATGIARAQELGWPANLAEMARVAAVGVKAFSAIKSANVGSTGNPTSGAGGGASSAPTASAPRQQEPPVQSSVFEFKGFSELSQKLAQFDPNDPLPAEVAQRIAAGIENIRTLEGGTA